ncbi:WG repeat-containing protein [Pseudomonas fluorescens]|uniref:WG repeat-containing protein n=1 Tax=Pseudomonas fluorescens TaxID=294 RepID=UPI00177CD7D5|nr:WG repeat-containing protein [Pseudomonas fluorescens]MBD8240423.1 WG repeat-containing protein [Pseudomonas fluorescens]MDY0897180.1 WG repeat-containing protein [Pseudomonas fluorescens]
MKTALTRTKLLASALVVVAVIGGAAYYLFDRHVITGLVSGTEYSDEQLNEGAVDDLHSLTLAQAKKRLNYLEMDARDSINQIAMIESMRLEISPVANTAESPGEKKQLRYDEPFVPFPAAELKTALEDLAPKKPTFEQFFFDNQSGLKLDLEPIRELLKRGALPDQREEERYAVHTLYFRDGTQQAFADAGPDISEEQDTSTVELKVNKPVERVSVTLTYPSYPGFKKIVLDPKHPKVTGDNGEVYQLTALADERASLLLATPKDKTYVIEGLSADGKTLYSGGNSSNSSPTAEQKANLRAYYDELLRMQDQFSRYTTSAELQEHLEQFVKGLPDSDGALTNVQATYQFEDTPASIVIYLLDPAQPQPLTLEMHNSVPAQARYIAYDNATKKSGFIDSNGQWVVKPRFERIEYSPMPGVFNMQVGRTPQKDGWSQLQFKYFAFVPGGHTLKELPFEIIEKPLNDELMIVERETNGPYGVYDVKKQQVVVPMKYVNVQVVGDLFIARPGLKTYGGDSSYGVWNLAGKELLAPRFSNIDVVGDHLYTTSADGGQIDIYTLKLQKLNPPGSTAIGAFIQGQPQLLQDRKNRKYRFINAEGKPLPISLPYDEVEPFSNGMAVVKKGERYGALDLTGKLRVPLKYTRLNPFQKNLASAEMDGFRGLVLIDKNNTLVKKLGSYTTYSRPTNSNDATYSIWDAKDENRVNVFNADGVQVDSYQRE